MPCASIFRSICVEWSEKMMPDRSPVTEQDTVAVSHLPTRTQGSPNTEFEAATEHDVLPTQAADTTSLVLVAWHDDGL